MEFLRKRTLSKLSENFSSRKAAKAQRILASLRLGANILLWIVFSITLQAQPFANEIADFKKADSISKPPANPILFVGSSSFRLWADIQSYFPGYTILNRGFGGSNLLDVIRYADDVIFAYNPKQIVIYCGENDIASSETVSADTVYNRFRQLFFKIRDRYPTVPVAFVAMKPSPSRYHLIKKVKKGNKQIKKFLSKQSNTAFINVFDPMLNKDGKPREELFVEDRLHMNPEGYRIWQQLITPYLLK